MAIGDAGTGTCLGVAFSTNGSTYYPFGIVTGGSVRDADQVQHRRGAGGIDVPRGTFYTPGVNVTYLPVGATAQSLVYMTDTGSLLRRGAGTWPLTNCTNLTPFYVRYGMNGTAGGTFYLDYANCKVNSFSLDAAVDSPLSATLDILSASNIAESSNAPPSMALSGENWEWYHGSVSLNGGTYVVQSFSVSLENGLIPLSDLDSPGYTGGRRVPKRMLEGDETCRITVTTANRIPISVRGNTDELTDNLTFFAQFTNADSKVLTISASNLINSSGEHPVEAAGGVVMYQYGFEAKIQDTSTNHLRVTYSG